MIWFRRTIIALAVIVALIVISIVFLLTVDLSRFKSLVEEQVSEITGREFIIGGQFRPEFGETITLVAEDIRLANADWGTSDDILAIGRLQIAVDLWSLFDRPVRIENFELDDTSIFIEVHPDTAQSSWQFSDSDAAREDVDNDEDSGFDLNDLPVILRQVRISNFKLQYGQGWLPERKNIFLESLSVGEGANAVADLRASGSIAGLAMQLTGSVGPLHGIRYGKEITLDLRASLDELEASVRGRIEDLYAFSGADIELTARGPDAELLFAEIGLPPLAAGDIDLKARLWSDAEGIYAVAVGGIGGLTVDINGHTESLDSLHATRLEVDVEGPNLHAIGSILGIDQLPEQQFKIRGGFSTADDRIVLDAVSFNVGDASLVIDGSVNLTGDLQDSLVTINLHAPDVSTLLDQALGEAAPSGVFKLTGKVEPSTRGPELRDVSGSLGDDRLSLTGALGTVPGFRGLNVRTRVYGPDLAATLAPWTDTSLPAESYDVSIRVSSSGETFSLHDLSLRIGENDLTVDGLIGALPDLDGMDAEIKLSAPAFQKLLQPLEAFETTAERLDVRGRLSKPRDQFLLHDIRLTFDELNQLQLDGSLGKLPELDGLRLAVRAKGPDATPFDTFESIRLPAEPFSIGGEISKTAEGWFVRDWTGVIGDDSWALDGALGDGEDIAGVDLEIRVSGSDLRDFLVNAPQIDMAIPYSLSGDLGVEDDVIEVRDFDFLLGATTGTISGTIPISSELTDAEFEVHLAGPDLGRLSRNLSLGTLPDGPFSFDGKLSSADAAYVVEDFAIKLSDSDIGGNLTITPGARPRIQGNIKAINLDLNQLIPPKDDGVENAGASGGSDRVIPDIPLPLDALELADLDLLFEIESLRFNNIGLRNVESRVLLRDHALNVTTTNIGLERGTLQGELRFSNLASEGQMYLRLAGSDVNLRPPVTEQGEALARPPIDIDLELTGSGQTLRQLAATLNGTFQVTQGEGEVDSSFSGLLMSDVLAQIVAAINPFSEKKKHTNLRCGVMNIGFIDGVATANAIVFQTDELAIASVGSIDFGTEALDLSFRTQVRQGIGISVSSVVNPYLRVGGTLAKPKLQIDKKRGLLSGSVAVLTAGLSILAQGMWDRYLSADNMCEAVLADIESGAIGDTAN